MEILSYRWSIMRTLPSDAAPVNKQGTSRQLELFPPPLPQLLAHEKELMVGKDQNLTKATRTLPLTTSNITKMLQLLRPPQCLRRPQLSLNIHLSTQNTSLQPGHKILQIQKSRLQLLQLNPCTHLTKRGKQLTQS
jgi:hypothetical protein